jgi:hypothetical protein
MHGMRASCSTLMDEGASVGVGVGVGADVGI